jgi:nicotinate phosphoribosyltransferase
MKESPQQGKWRVAGAAPDEIGLFTDLYELTMLQAYFEEEMMAEAVFTLFVRRLPLRRNLLIACGIGTVLGHLENLRFPEESIAYLASLGKFTDRFLDWLGNFRFTGDIYALPEGTPLFANEPILEVVAPLPQAQLIETLVMNQVHLQTVLASKAVRVVAAAGGRPVIDFGARRMHGIDAALNAARAFYIGGVTATSNVLAGKRFGLPVAGTMAHSYIQAHDDELAAFRGFARIYPETVLLVDTYETMAGVRNVIQLAKELGDDFRVRAVRLDSGDLLVLSRETRRLLDDAALHQVGIFASGGLDEEAIAMLLSAGAPIDGFGVGTSMGVAEDAPTLDIAYKLCEYAGEGRLKLSAGKPVLPGRKQIFRLSREGVDVGDVIARADEKLPGRPLLEQVMSKGERLPAGTVDLQKAREHAQEQLRRLPATLRSIVARGFAYPVEVSAELAEFQAKVARKVGKLG